MIEFKEYRGSEIAEVVEALVGLRIEVFREYPYLYEGDLEGERVYAENYALCKTGYVAVAVNDGDVVGAITCVALNEAERIWQAAFEENGLSVDDYCYFGEVVLLKGCRGKGFGRTLIDMALGYAREIGKKHTCLCMVERPHDHLLRPSDYNPLDLLLIKRGYVKHPEIKSVVPWPQIDNGNKDVVNTLTFWIK